jgi:hypothetical protein
MKHDKETPHPIPEAHLKKIAALMENISFGTITLIIQDGVLVQIEYTEKERLR